MITLRTLTGSTIWEQLNPPFRMVDFSDSPAVITVSHYLRLAWGFKPDESYSCDEVGIGRFMRETQAKLMAETEALAAVEGEAAKDEVVEKNEDEDVIMEEDIEAETDVKIAIVPEPEVMGDSTETEETKATEAAATVNPAEDQEPQPNSEDGTLSEWRLAILTFWNHVFWDVMQFLPHVGMGIGHFHPPSHTSLSINFPPNSHNFHSTELSEIENTATSQKPALTHTFATNTLIIPTYLAPGVKLRMTTSSSSASSTPPSSDLPPNSNPEAISSSLSSTELGTFTHETKTECWWLRQGVEVNIYIDADTSSPSSSSGCATCSSCSPAAVTNGEEIECSKGGEGKVAAVLAIGVLCDEMHEEAVQAIEEEEGQQQEILEAEMEIQVDGPVLEVH